MINSISGYGSTTTRLTGLVSGLDVDALVEAMTMGTTSKIESKQADKQLLEWEIAAYRNISSKMIDFSEKYFSFSSDMNLLSMSAYESSTPSVTNDAFKNILSVSGDADIAKKVNIENILSVASKAQMTSSSTVTNHTLSSKPLGSLADVSGSNLLAGETIEISLPDSEEPIEITFADDFSSTDSKEIAREIQRQIDANPELSGLTIAVERNEDDDGDVFAFQNETGEKISISGNALDTLRISSGSIGVGNEHLSRDIDENNFKSDLSLKGASMSLSLNGVNRTIELTGDYADNDALISDLNTLLADEFGDGKMTASINADGSVGIKTNSNTDTLSITAVDQSVEKILGFEAGQYNRINMSKNIDELVFSGGSLDTSDNSITINGVKIEYDPSEDTISDLMTKINGSDAGVNLTYSTLTDKFTLESKETGSQAEIDVSGNLASLLGLDTATTIKGTDTVVEMEYNGENLTVTSSNSSIKFDGLTIGINDNAVDELQRVKDELAAEGTAFTGITFKSETDTTKLMEVMEEFVNDYNEILDLVSEEVSTTKSSSEREYTPLTEEQKADMTEKQIEDWEAIAKKGLLSGSTELNSLRTELRYAVTGMLSGNELASYIGFGTSSDYTANGKIEFDADAFEEALLEDPTRVIEMLTKSFDDSLVEGSSEYNQSGGIMSRIKSVTDKYSSNIGEKGILIQKAGLDNSVTSLNNTLANKVSDIDDQIDALLRTLETQEERYYGQFSELEVYLSQMESQSAWLYEQTASM